MNILHGRLKSSLITAFAGILIWVPSQIAHAQSRPQDDVIKQQAEKVWRIDHAAEIAKAKSVSFQYQPITVKPMEKRPPGTNATDLLYEANINLSVSISPSQPQEPAVDYKAEQNQCFYKKQDGPIWSTIPCTRRYFVRVDPKVLDTYAGQYEMPAYGERHAFVVNVYREGNKLMSEAFANKAEFRPLSETEFYMKENDTMLKFVKDEDGHVKHIVWADLIVKKIK